MFKQGCLPKIFELKGEQYIRRTALIRENGSLSKFILPQYDEE